MSGTKLYYTLVTTAQYGPDTSLHKFARVVA